MTLLHSVFTISPFNKFILDGALRLRVSITRQFFSFNNDTHSIVGRYYSFLVYKKTIVYKERYEQITQEYPPIQSKKMRS